MDWKFVVELIVFAVILYEIRQLRKHEHQLSLHGKKLDQSMPLFTTLLTEPSEIQELAVAMICDAKEMWAIGVMNVLARTEINPAMDSGVAIQKPSDFDKRYTAATADYINTGGIYSRVMNLALRDGNYDDVWNAHANIRFFRRLLEGGRIRDLHVCLYHHPDLLSTPDEFHFRVTDKKVAIRVGSPKGGNASAAISITDTRVIKTFFDYCTSLVGGTKCIQLDLPKLCQLDDLLSASDLAGYNRMLERG